MRISDWSSDVCSSDLLDEFRGRLEVRRGDPVSLAEHPLLAGHDHEPVQRTAVALTRGQRFEGALGRRRREQQHAWVFDRLVLGRDGCWSRERTERAPIGLHDVPEGLLPVAIIAGVLEPLRKLVGEKRLRRVRLEDAMQSLRSEEHTSELQSLMPISYAFFCLKKK